MVASSHEEPSNMNAFRSSISVLAAMVVLAVCGETGLFAGPSDGGAAVVMPGSPFGVAWGFLYGYLGVKADVFVPGLRQMGAGCTKVYLMWNQVEPEKGRYTWDAVDKFLDQLKAPEDGLIAVFSSSTWATRQAVPLLPPSPAKDPEDYYRFIHALVGHCKGRVRYWQNDCEPNNAVYWSGTAQEFVAQLKVFHRAVKDADPDAVVVVGGYDGLFNPPGTPPKPGQERGLAFFDQVLKEGRDHFDIFDLRLYADPYTIPDRVSFMRRRMSDLGYEKPMICTEYNGPGFFEFPVNRRYVTLVQQWAASIASDKKSKGQDSTGGGGQNAVAGLYARMDSLAPETQMFMAGCSEELNRKFHRIQCRDLVMRNVLALSAGIQKTMYWDLWHDTSTRYDLMHLMYAKHKLMDYEGGVLKEKSPAVGAFRRMVEYLDGVEQVSRIKLDGRPSVYLFAVSRHRRGPVYVAWERRDVFTGEDQPAVPFEWRWDARGAKAIDALGTTVPVTVGDGRLRLTMSLTPIFIEPTE
jgi:hypothetical protein